MKLLIEVGDDTYDVDVDLVDEETAASIPRGYVPPLRPVRPGAAAKGAAQRGADDDGRICRSPLRGIVSRVNVEPGQRVREGEVVMVLEAMKMETNLVAPRDATVATVAAPAGAAVQIGQILLQFE